MAKERWAGVVDSVGSHTLANALAQTQYRGVIAAFGLAQGADLPASVLPFILRNVTLAGVNSVNAPQPIRLEAWSRLASDLDLGKLARTTQVIGLADVPGVVGQVLDGKVRGRTIVDVNALLSYHCDSVISGSFRTYTLANWGVSVIACVGLTQLPKFH